MKNDADPDVVLEIRRLAEQIENVRLTRQAKSDLLAWNVATAEVCEAICDWIDSRRPVHVIVTKHAAGHVGQPAYVMKPHLTDMAWYVKVSPVKPSGEDDYLLIISAHPNHR